MSLASHSTLLFQHKCRLQYKLREGVVISKFYVKTRKILVAAPYGENKVISGRYDRDTDGGPTMDTYSVHGQVGKRMVIQ